MTSKEGCAAPEMFNIGSALLASFYGDIRACVRLAPLLLPAAKELGVGGHKKKQKYENRYSLMLKPKATHEEVFAVRRSR